MNAVKSVWVTTKNGCVKYLRSDTFYQRQRCAARDVAAAPQTPQLGGAQTNFGGPS